MPPPDTRRSRRAGPNWSRYAWLSAGLLVLTIVATAVDAVLIAGAAPTIGVAVAGGAAALSALGGLLAGVATGLTARRARHLAGHRLHLTASVRPDPPQPGTPPWLRRILPHRYRIAAYEAGRVAAAVEAHRRMAVGGVLSPLAYLLGEISDARPCSPRLASLQAMAVRVVLSGAAELVGADGVRACYFRIAVGRARSPMIDPHRLELAGYYGCPEPTVVVLPGDTDLGELAFRLIERGQAEFYPDLARRAPTGWADGGQHRSLVVCPVRTDRERFGLLTLETRPPARLRDRDAEVVDLLGGLLAVALNR